MRCPHCRRDRGGLHIAGVTYQCTACGGYYAADRCDMTDVWEIAGGIIFLLALAGLALLALCC